MQINAHWCFENGNKQTKEKCIFSKWSVVQSCSLLSNKAPPLFLMIIQFWIIVQILCCLCAICYSILNNSIITGATHMNNMYFVLDLLLEIRVCPQKCNNHLGKVLSSVCRIAIPHCNRKTSSVQHFEHPKSHWFILLFFVWVI